VCPLPVCTLQVGSHTKQAEKLKKERTKDGGFGGPEDGRRGVWGGGGARMWRVVRSTKAASTHAPGPAPCMRTACAADEHLACLTAQLECSRAWGPPNWACSQQW